MVILEEGLIKNIRLEDYVAKLQKKFQSTTSKILTEKTINLMIKKRLILYLLLTNLKI